MVELQGQNSIQEYRRAVLQIFSQDHPGLPSFPNRDSEKLFLSRSQAHSLQPLLHYYASQEEAWQHWPSSLRGQLEEATQQAGYRESLREREWVRVLEVFREKGVLTLFLKGSALAISDYPESYLRPRGDTDLLIRPQDLKRTKEIFKSLGYEVDQVAHGRKIGHQYMAVRRDELGFVHIFDVHWKLSNPGPFSRVLNFDEMMAEARRVKVMGTEICIPSGRHALLHSLIHLVAHHHGAENLIWLFDIHLLVEKHDRAWFESFGEFARRKEMRGVCRVGLLKAQKWFGTNLYDDLMNTYFSESAGGEEHMLYLAEDVRLSDLLVADFKLAGSFKDKIQFFSDLLFPSPAFMFSKYQTKNRLALPWLYFHRVFFGFWRVRRKVRGD